MSSAIDTILETGNALISSVQGLVDWQQQPTGAGQANLLVSAAGVVAGILTSEAGHTFTRTLASVTNMNLAVLGVATNGMLLADALREYNAAPPGNRDAEYRNLADKLYGTIGAIGAAVATIPTPQTRTLGLTAWGLATLMQNSANGNISKLLTFMGQEMWNAFSDVLSGQQGQTWTADVGNRRAISGSVMGSDWTNPGWQGTDRSIVIAWHEFDAAGRSVSYRSTISVATGAALADIIRAGSVDYHVEAVGQRPGESFGGYVDRVNSDLTSMGGGWQSWNGEIDTGGGGGGSGNKKFQFQSTDDPDYGIRGAFRFIAPEPAASDASVQEASTLIEAMAAFSPAGATDSGLMTAQHPPQSLVIAVN